MKWSRIWFACFVLTSATTALSFYLLINVVDRYSSGKTAWGEGDENLMFGEKVFYDASGSWGEGDVYITGTLTGPGVTYKNNSVAITCLHDRRECVTYSIEQIGPNQVGRLDAPAFWPVTQWSRYEVVASGPGDFPNCHRVTISIQRDRQTALWVTEPINQASSACKGANTQLYKWTVEDSPGEKALRAAVHAAQAR
jgi:hypothetical protein